MASDAAKVYLGVVDRLEPELTAVDRDAALASIAISLKRIADSADEITEFMRRCSPR